MRGQHRRELRAFAQVKGHHPGEGRGAEFADELDEFEYTRIPIGPRFFNGSSAESVGEV